MNYPNWAEIQQNPNPNSEFSVLHAPIHSLGYSQNISYDPFQPSNVDPYSALSRPPGVDPPPQPYVPPPVPVNYVQQPIGFETPQGADTAAYYPDPNVSWQAAMPQFGTTSYTADIISTPNPAIQPQNRLTWKKAPQKTKLVQSAWCEVCKIDCNSKGVLDQHKLGKKHLKNLKKSITPAIYAPIIAAPIIVEPPYSIAVVPAAPVATYTPLPVPNPAPVPTSAFTDQPIIGPLENPEISKSRSQKSRKKLAAQTDDLETKRRKVMEGGAAANAVRACNICNVVCNSDTVFNFHLAGQKHASMAKKYVLSAGSVASAM